MSTLISVTTPTETVPWSSKDSAPLADVLAELERIESRAAQPLDSSLDEPQIDIGSWDYRVVRTERPVKGTGIYSEFAVMEVYYDSTGKITGWIDQNVAPYGGSMEELSADLEYIVQALAAPVINRADLPK